MKKLIFLSIAILFAGFSIAQNTFEVPERIPEKHYNRAVWIMHYNLNVAINYAKSMGQTAEEFGKYCGDLYKLTWDKNGGFQNFVVGNLTNLSQFADKVEIVSQTENKVVLRVTGFYKYLQDKNVIMDVSYSEYLDFFRASHAQIADYLNCSILFKEVDDFIEITLTPKQHEVTLNIFTPYFYINRQKVNGWIKEISYQTYKGIIKDGKVTKGKAITVSEANNNRERLKHSYLFNRKGELSRIAEYYDDVDITWVGMAENKNGRIEKFYYTQNGIPMQKGDLLYDGCNFLGSNWYNLETNELDRKLRVETDENGFVTNRKTYNEKDELVGQGPRLVRNSDGAALERSYLNKDGSVNYHVKFTYNKNGLPINMHRTIAKGEPADNNFKREYEFDENGNWVKQIQYGPPASEVFVIERTFTYYQSKTEIELNEALLAKYLGKYQLAPDFFITVTEEDKKMFAQGTGESKFEIAPMSENRFFAKSFEVEIEFHIDEKGKTTGLTIIQGTEMEAIKVE